VVLCCPYRKVSPFWSCHGSELVGTRRDGFAEGRESAPFAFRGSLAAVLAFDKGKRV